MIEIKSKEIKMLPLAQLKQYSKNRNTHPEKQIERLAKLYEGHGFRDPLIVCEDTMQIIAGNGRAQAAKIAGMTEVPVILQKFADEDARYAFMVSHNAIQDWSELDMSKINFDLSELGPDLDLELLGIKDFTLDIADKNLDLSNEKQTSTEGYMLTVVLNNEHEQNILYEDLISRGYEVKVFL